MGLNVLLDGIKDETVFLSVANRPAIPTAKRKLKKIPVPGRDGDLTKFEGYEDVQLPIDFNILEDRNIKGDIRKIKAWLMNKDVLSFSDDPDYFRKIKNVDIGNVDNEVEFYGSFTADFLLGPFEYQKTISKAYTNSPVTLTNPGTYFSQPLIKIKGTGTVVLTVNNVGITLKNLTDEIILDSELGEAYKGLTTNMNENMSGPFPLFVPGINKISWTGAVTKIEIDERWRYL